MQNIAQSDVRNQDGSSTSSTLRDARSRQWEVVGRIVVLQNTVVQSGEVWWKVEVDVAMLNIMCGSPRVGSDWEPALPW